MSRFRLIKGQASLNAAPKLFTLSLSILSVDTPQRQLPAAPPLLYAPSLKTLRLCHLCLHQADPVTCFYKGRGGNDTMSLGWDLKCLPASIFVLKEGAATMLERGHEGREVLEQRGVSPASPGCSSHPRWERVMLSCSLQLQWSHSVKTQWHRSKPAVYTAHCSNCKTVNKYMRVFWGVLLHSDS